MLRPLVSCLAIALLPLASYGSGCHAKVTRSEAIRIAERQFSAEHGRAAAGWYSPWRAQLHGCVWRVTGYTPPRTLSGDAHVDVAADTGKAVVQPIMRTDPRKVQHLKPRQASNQAMQRTAGRSAFYVSDDFHIQPAATRALASGR